MIQFDVLGSPASKGSNRAMLRGGRAVFVPGGSRVNQAAIESWSSAVRSSIAIDLFDGSMPVVPLFVDRPLAVGIVFRMARPRGHWGKGKNAGKLSPTAPTRPSVKPDIDKLTRSTLDAMHGSIFDDDSRIVELGVVKVYAEPGNEGASISVKEWTP